MTALEQAVQRLSAAVELAETRVANAGGAALEADGKGMSDLFGDDRDTLLARIRALEEQAAEDAALRVEAAAAVKAALADLRAVHGDDGQAGTTEHA
ncbi:MAG: hypothetical protein AAF160_01545 [Pseudomonadota bacterium]